MLLWTTLLIFIAVVMVPVLGIGVLLVSACLRHGWQATERVTATVVDHEISEDEEGTYYTPVARFLSDGKAFLVKGGLAQASRPAYRVGQPVTVYHPPGQPDKAMLGRFEGLWIGLLLAIVGTAFLWGVAVEVARLFR